MTWLKSVWDAQLVGNTRLRVVILLIAAAGGLAAIAWSYSLPEPRIVLFEGRRFHPSELTLLQSAFAKNNLDDWQCDDGQLTVPRSQRSQYIQAAEKADALPPGLNASWDPSMSSSLLDTRESRAEKRRHLLQSELSRLIQALRGIDEATVRYSEHVRSGLHREMERRALVAVRAEGEKPLSGMQVHAIQRTVVAAVVGLRAEDVTVTDLNFPTAWAGIPSQIRPSQIRPSQIRDDGSNRPLDPPMPTNINGPNQPDRVASDRQQAPAKRAEAWVSRVAACLHDLDGVQVSVEPSPLKTPSVRPVVHVQGDTSLSVKLCIPMETLRQHFGGVETPAARLPQLAAEHLQPVIENVTRRPTSLLVTVAPPPVPATAISQTTPLAPVSSDAQPVSGHWGWPLGLTGLVLSGYLVHRSGGLTRRSAAHRSSVSVFESEFQHMAGAADTAETPPGTSHRDPDVHCADELFSTMTPDSDDSKHPRPEQLQPSASSRDRSPDDEESSVIGDAAPLWTETLERERPQVIAAMLSQMPPADAAVVLGGMCEDLGSDVLRRIGNLTPVHSEVRTLMWKAVGASLEHRRQANARRAEGTAAVQAILSASESFLPTGVKGLAGVEREGAHLDEADCCSGGESRDVDAVEAQLDRTSHS